MRVIIAGGTGFLGSALRRQLESSGHEVIILTRREPRSAGEISWDGRSQGEWTRALEQADAVVHATGYGLEHWPWTRQQKQRFADSRVLPGKALAQGIAGAVRKPRTFVQISGVNYYGARGEGVADEASPPAGDFLAQLAVQWEAATQGVEDMGVRRATARSAVILDRSGGLLPLMVLPVRLGFGGPLGDGRQAVPWIHVEDQARALQFLLENETAKGPFNLIAPSPTSNADFMNAAAKALHRPYWFRTPGVLLRLVLGEMSTLVLDGRYSAPKCLDQLGFAFKFPSIGAALGNLYG